MSRRPRSTKGLSPTEDPVANYASHAFTVPWDYGGPGGTYPDHILITGFNVIRGFPRDPTQAALWLQLEHQFRNGPTAPFASEVHWNFRGPVRGQFVGRGVSRWNATLVGWQ